MTPYTDFGDLIVISAPSGTGKTTLIRAVMQSAPSLNFSISTTTRPPREGEREGEDYFFVSEAHFREMIEEMAFLEWAEVHGNFYGTSKDVVFSTLKVGDDVIMDIDVQGAAQVKEAYPEAFLILIVPPSYGELKRRLENRLLDTPEVITTRLKNAQWELEQYELFNCVIINRDLPHAVEDLIAIIRSRRLCRQRMADFVNRVLTTFPNRGGQE